MEGQIFIKTGKLISLSESFLVDCSFENGACDGGLPSLGFEFLERCGVVFTEASWPYQPRVRLKSNDTLDISNCNSFEFKTMCIFFNFCSMHTRLRLICCCFLLQKRECDAAKGKFGGTGYGYISFKKGDEQDLKRAVAKFGPISVAFSALDDLFDYESGEFIRLSLLIT